MPLLQAGISPAVAMILFLFLVVSVPLLVGAVVLINRTTGTKHDEEIAELQERVDELESEHE
ncbi:MAG: hypothetical protein V5A45_02220 [Haloarculaceae archaeon]